MGEEREPTRGYGQDIGEDGVETLAEVTLSEDGSMSLTVVRVEDDDEAATQNPDRGEG